MNDIINNRLMITSIIAPAIIFGREHTDSEYEGTGDSSFVLEFEKSKDRKGAEYTCSVVPQGILIQFDDNMVLMRNFEEDSEGQEVDNSKDEPDGTSKEDIS